MFIVICLHEPNHTPRPNSKIGYLTPEGLEISIGVQNDRIGHIMANDSFRPIGALFFRNKWNFSLYALNFIEISKKYTPNYF